jgi:hypothetical protein
MAFLLLILSYLGKTVEDFAHVDFIYTLFYLLVNLNSSINFIVYCASGTKFRNRLILMCYPLHSSRKSLTNSGGQSRDHGISGQSTTPLADLTTVSMTTVTATCTSEVPDRIPINHGTAGMKPHEIYIANQIQDKSVSFTKSVAFVHVNQIMME